jgi:glycerol-3-phosphate dehydrogenase
MWRLKTDILIIGGGVIGAAIAYRMCRYRLDIAWVEKENDVCMGTSKSNSSMAHDGYNVDGHKLKGQMVLKSHPQYAQLCKDLHVPYVACGSVFAGLEDEDMSIIKAQLEMGRENGIERLRIVDHDELMELEPNINPKCRFGLYNPNTGVLDPFQFTLAMGENAVMNGVKFFRNTEVTAIRTQNGKILSVETTRGPFEPKVVINSAGLYSDKVAAMAEEIDFSVKPRRGQYFVYDKKWKGLINNCIYSAPTPTSKGMIIVPTTEGNILAGSNAVLMDDKEDSSTRRQEMDGIYLDLVHRYLPQLPRAEEVITSFVGLRSVSNTEDFIIAHSKTVRGMINLAGIQSPGLSSATGISEMVEGLVREVGDGLDFRERGGHIEGRPKPRVFRDMAGDELSDLIKKDPDYGTIVCRCETVSKGEILSALRGPIPAMDLDGVKRRVRAGMGRCQGGFCGPKVMALLQQEMKVSLLDLTKRGHGSFVLGGRLKDLSLMEGGARGEKVKL